MEAPCGAGECTCGAGECALRSRESAPAARGERKDEMDYRELSVWKMGMRLAKEVYKTIIPKLPEYEKYGLSNQMSRAAVSIPSNIAEGHSRESTKKYIQFLTYAKGSLAELQTQLLLSVEIDYLSEADVLPIIDFSNDLLKKLNKLLIALKNK